MPKASVVALLAAGPLLLASSSIAFAQTAAKAPATDAPSPSAAPKAQKDTPQPKAANAKAPAKTNPADSKSADKHDAAASDSKAPATEPSANTPSDATSSTAADATTAPSDSTESTSSVDAGGQVPRSTLPALQRGAGEPSPSPVTGPLLPAGLAPAAEPAPAAATTATAADKEAKGEDSVFAEDWWSHARPILELHGYFRTRAEMFHNFSLGRLSQPDQALWTMPADNRYTTPTGYGPALCTPGESDEVPGDSSAAVDAHYACKNKNNSGANLRFRINPELHISDNLRILSQIDLLDNLVLGSTPAGYANEPAAGGYAVVRRNGYAPMSFFDSTTIPPTAGVNSYTNSIAVKRVWGEFSTPLGQLRFGRMPDHFGLGMYHNAGDGYDDDYQSTIDRIMFISSVKPLDLYFAGAWDFPSSGPTNQSLQDLQAQPYNVANSVNVRQFSLMLMRQKSPQLQKLSLSRGSLVVNGGAYLQYRWQDLAADGSGTCQPSGQFNAPNGAGNNPTNIVNGGPYAASLGCPSWGVSAAMVRRGARAFTPDLWLQVLYKKFRFEAEAVTVQGSIDNVSNTEYQFGNNTGGGSWKLQSYGIATEFQQRLLEDRLDLSLYWGWASGDPNAAQIDGSMGLQPGNNGLQTAEGSNKFTEFRFNPAYRIDLILNRNILTRVQGTYYLRPSIGYDFMRKTNGQRLGGNLAGIWTRASEYVQAPGHQRDLGIEVDASIYFQSKDGALNDKPGAQGGFYTMLQYGLLFPMGGLGYPGGGISTAGTSAYYQQQVGNADTSTAQILRWYMGIFY